MSFNLTTIHKDVLPLIFEYTHDVEDLKRVSLVCKRWRNFTNQACLNMLRTFGINSIKYRTRKQVIATVYFLSKIINANPKNATFLKIKACLPTNISSISHLRNIGEAFKENCIKTLKVILVAIETLCPEATTLKAILINQFGTLLLSAKHNNIHSLKFHLSKKTVLHYHIQHSLMPACYNGSYCMAKLLLKHGACPKSKRTFFSHETYLTAACKSNSFALVNLLVQHGANDKETNRDGIAPLAIAAQISFRIFKVLAKLSSKLSHTYGEDTENTLAHFAAIGNNPGVIRYMISNNAPIDRPNLQGATPLMKAIEAGSMDTFFELIECGADIASKSANSWTPLDYAVVHDRQRCIQFLLDQKISRTLKLNSLKIAVTHKNIQAVNKISASLGITSTVKYGSLVALSALVGGIAALAFFSESQE